MLIRTNSLHFFFSSFNKFRIEIVDFVLLREVLSIYIELIEDYQVINENEKVRPLS